MWGGRIASYPALRAVSLHALVVAQPEKNPKREMLSLERLPLTYRATHRAAESFQLARLVAHIKKILRKGKGPVRFDRALVGES